jgi:hypothetical protein
MRTDFDRVNNLVAGDGGNVRPFRARGRGTRLELAKRGEVMHIFGIVTLLLGLGAFALAMVVDRDLSIATELWAVVLVGLGIGAAWLADFDVWQLWGGRSRSRGTFASRCATAVGGRWMRSSASQ